ncbi:jerky protein homolog-like [Anastrepha obliqua]|uniref:jerky protein homolog-like n=1 Tax=Anastrepha obliqua TaxID=95512 RepID=UPI00240A6622|nr:jerky protein homolog-like [Anastrepha obliqua]
MEPSTTKKIPKRKRVVVTIETKLKIIEEIEKGSTIVSLSEKYDIPRTTIQDFKKDATQIKQYAASMESLGGRSKKRKTMKKALNEKVDEALFLWFNQIRSKGVPLSGQILKEKALFFNEKLGGPNDFKASSGWLYGWQNRHGVKKVSIQGEKMSSIGANEIEKCTENFKIFVENHGFTREQVFNADETGLNFKALPKKTLDFCVNSYAPGWKMQKQRITLMISTNSSG